MQTIELDQEFFDSVKNDNRDNVVNGIVNNVMSGEYEYVCVGEHWNLQDVINDALGSDFICKQVAYAVSNINCASSTSAIQHISIKARRDLTKIVESFCNQNDIGVE